MTSKGPTIADIYEQREVFYDGMERPRSEWQYRVLGVLTKENFFYDGLGRKIRQDRPYSTISNGYEAWSYDPVSRPFLNRLYQPSGALDRETNVTYAGRSTTVTDPLGRARTQVKDVVGRMRRAIDPAPGGTTSFDYDSFGNLNRIQDPIGAVSTGIYNARDFRAQWADADRGVWTFSGNSLKELVSWTDAKGQTFSATYDPLGRLTSRTEPEGTSVWTWGASSADRNVGRLASVSGYGYTELRFYDNLARLQTRRITTDQQYEFGYSYNAIGAVDVLSYPVSPVPAGKTGTRVKVQYGYSFGEVAQISDVTEPSAVPLWSVNSTNDYSSPTTETFGANLARVTSGFVPWTNELKTRQSGILPATSNRQNLSYQWDTVGNLTNRQDLNQALTETFTIDPLNRVTSSTLNGVINQTVGYDASGNITSKSDVGNYVYGNLARPHAVTAAGSRAFTYDSNGNQISRDGATQTWTSYNLPTVIAQPISGTTYQSQFFYGPTHQRWKQVSTYSNGTETTLYVGGLLEKESATSTGGTYWRHYVYTPSGMSIIVSRNVVGGVNSLSTNYVLTDHLGSGDAILNGTGAIQAATSFALFGSRRGSNWSAGTAPNWLGIANSTRHGFTGHEHLDNVNLIHMGGRVYDPIVGRFLSVDPLIGDVSDSQQINPYAYVGNRPLNWTDPTGLSAADGDGNNNGGGFGGGYQTNDGSPGTWRWWSNVFESIGDPFQHLFGSSTPPPPASAMQGMSAQNGTQPCSIGATSSSCTGAAQTELNDQAPSNSTAFSALSALESVVDEYGRVKLREREYERSPEYQEGMRDAYDAADTVASVLPAVRVAKAPVQAGEFLVRHHAWPKYLGGAVKQTYAKIERSVHEAYHGGLDKILPRQWGKAYYDQLTAKARAQMLRDLARYTKEFDAKYGTKLYEAMKENGFKLP